LNELNNTAFVYYQNQENKLSPSLLLNRHLLPEPSNPETFLPENSEILHNFAPQILFIISKEQMANKGGNIFPVFHETLKRKDKERILKQRSIAIWMSGLSGAGKTTIARHLEMELYNKGFLAQILDGDNIRSGINNNLTFSKEDRYENIRRIAEVSKLFLHCGIISINSFISPTDEIRNIAIEIIGKENVVEVFVNAPLSVCEQRDTKGLYAKARRGEILDFTGIDSPFDIPVNPDIEVHTDIQKISESVQQILDYVLPLIEYKEDKNNNPL
jgi:adenylylsulfate kinase